MKRYKCLFALALAVAFISPAPLLRADEPSSQRTAAVEELLKTMHADEMMDRLFAKQRDAITQMVPSFLPKDASPETVQQMQEMMPKVIDAVYKQITWESMKPEVVQVYKEEFSTQEIRQLIAFYKSPIGQKFVDKTPVLQAKSLQIMQKNIPVVMAELQKVIMQNMEQTKPGAKAKDPVTATTSTDTLVK